MPAKTKKILKFPPGFLWGAATSAYQVEGGISNNDWAVSNRVPVAGLACDQYHRFEADFQLAKKLHHNAHRLSLEWSRIEPQRDQWNEEELAHYVEVLKALQRRGMKTFLTLHHVTNPVWMASLGGWANPEVILDFAEYTSRVVQALGPYVDFWLTINEPDIYAAAAYVQGIFPPFKKNLWQAWRVMNNLLSAHNKAYEIIHGYYPKSLVSFAQNVPFVEPADGGNIFDRMAARFSQWLSYGYAFEHTHLDFLAVNHYFHDRIRLTFNPAKFFFGTVKSPHGKFSDRGWEIYPEGLYKVLLDLRKYRKPIYITENGLADRTDRLRGDFIEEYLRETHRAIKKGADVRGYLHWSLLDNFEWEDGYKWKFGLVAVDFKTFQRKVRKSARYYAEICKTNSLP